MESIRHGIKIYCDFQGGFVVGSDGSHVDDGKDGVIWQSQSGCGHHGNVLWTGCHNADEVSLHRDTSSD